MVVMKFGKTVHILTESKLTCAYVCWQHSLKLSVSINFFGSHASNYSRSSSFCAVFVKARFYRICKVTRNFLKAVLLLCDARNSR